MTGKTIGLHVALYVSEELVKCAQDEAAKLPLRVAMHDKVTALEMLAVLLLQQTGRLQR